MGSDSIVLCKGYRLAKDVWRKPVILAGRKSRRRRRRRPGEPEWTRQRRRWIIVPDQRPRHGPWSGAGALVWGTAGSSGWPLPAGRLWADQPGRRILQRRVQGGWTSYLPPMMVGQGFTECPIGSLNNLNKTFNSIYCLLFKCLKILKQLYIKKCLFF